MSCRFLRLGHYYGCRSIDLVDAHSAAFITGNDAPLIGEGTATRRRIAWKCDATYAQAACHKCPMTGKLTRR
jgi:hypothetical protein